MRLHPRRLQSWLLALFLGCGSSFCGITLWGIWSDFVPYASDALGDLWSTSFVVGTFALLAMCAVRIRSDMPDRP